MRDAGGMWLMREQNKDTSRLPRLLDVDSLQKLLLDLLVLLLHLHCTCTYLHLHLQTGQAGGRTHPTTALQNMHGGLHRRVSGRRSFH